MGRHDARVLGQRSAFAHALGGLGCGAGANLLLDAATDVGIDILPIGERLAQDRLADAAQKAAGDLIDQLRPLRIVEDRSEEHTSELQSLMRISYAVFCLKKKTKTY